MREHVEQAVCNLDDALKELAEAIQALRLTIRDPLREQHELDRAIRVVAAEMEDAS